MLGISAALLIHATWLSTRTLTGPEIDRPMNPTLLHVSLCLGVFGLLAVLIVGLASMFWLDAIAVYLAGSLISLGMTLVPQLRLGYRMAPLAAFACAGLGCVALAIAAVIAARAIV